MARIVRSALAPAQVIDHRVMDARTRAEAILRRAEADAAGLRAAAHAEGLAEGLAAGRDRAAAQVLELARLRSAMIAETRAALPGLAVALAQELIGDHVTRVPEHIVARVAPLLTQLQGARLLSLHVHPGDAPALREALSTDGALPAGLTVVEDADLARGGCIARSDVGTLDASVEFGLGALTRALREPG